MSAPSFSSFPPSFSSFPDLEAGSTKNEARDQDNAGGTSNWSPSRGNTHRERDQRKHAKKKNRERERKRDFGYPGDNKQKRPHSRSLDDERSKGEEDRRARLGTRYDGGTPGLFVVDKKGDPMNILYGGLHVGDIPRYRRVGYGNVLGLGKAFKIVTRGTGGKSLEIGIGGRRPPARYTDARSYALLTTTRPRQLLPVSGSRDTGSRFNGVDAQADFIRLPSRRSDIPEKPLSTYRSIHSSKDNDSDSNSDTSYTQADGDSETSSESDAGSSAPRSAHQHALASLEADLQKDPTSLPTWFALLDETLSTIPISTKSSLNRARAEIKLAVLDRAMKTHARNKASVELRIRWLGAGAEIWDAEKLEKEWETAVRELSGQKVGSEGKDTRNRMWEAWLCWRASSAGKGTRKDAGIEGIVEDAIRASANMEGDLFKLKGLWWAAVILKGAGFSERAMAIFQAQIELTFNCPPSLLSKPLGVRLDALEEFWETEIPRIGEANARGWDSWERERRRNSPIHEQSSSNLGASRMDVDSVSDPFMRWAADESRADTAASMPKRTDDSDDPYATILFSDVRPLLLDITSTDAKRALRLAWLEFMGLHIPGFAASLYENPCLDCRDDMWSRTHLSQATFIRQLFPPPGKGKEREWDAYAGTIIAREKYYASAFGCVKEWGMGVFGPLEGPRDGRGRMWEDVDVEGLNKPAVRRIFEQLRRRVKIPTDGEDEEWDVMALAFEAATNLKSAVKLSRTFLSASRSSLRLWGAHARLERLRGKVDEARRIYDAALSASVPPDSTAAVWWDWAEMEWLSGSDENAQAVIFRAAGVDPETRGSMGILRTRRALEDRIRSSEGSGRWKEGESWVCLRALLELLLGGTDAMQDAMEVMENYMRDFGLKAVPRESLRTHMLLMGWKHANMLGRQFRRRQVAEKVLKIVQEDERHGGGANTVVLGVFLDGEKGESVWGRIRALVGEGVGGVTEERGLTFGRREKSVTRRVWEVWLASWEKGRWEAEAERVRNSLDVGVGDERTRASPILWRLYVQFEIYSGELKRAKGLLFRAVSECPLVKELYLLAFGPLRSVFAHRELEGWAETMAERGIRMHKSLDEYVSGGVYDASSGDEEQSAGEEELEREARDYRRLAPF